MAWSEQRTLKHGDDEHVVRRGADGVYHLGPPPKRAVELRSPPKVVKPPPPVRVRRAKPVKAEPKDGPSDLQKRSTKFQVEAKMNYMRTNAGRIELIDRLEEYERQHQLAPIVDEPSRNFVRENREVEYPEETKRRIADTRRATIKRREQAVITKNEREQQEITRRNMASHAYKQVAQKRNEELAKCVARLNRSQGSARCRRWLSLYVTGLWTLKRSEALARDRRKRANLKRMRATLQIIRFLHKTCKTRTLHRAASTILYVARLLKAQNGFRMACKKLCFCVVRTQRHYRHRRLCTNATEELASLQWYAWARRRDVDRITPEIRKRLIRDMWRDKRQKHFLAMINWEAYDLKPLLIEAVCMTRERSRGEVRVFCEEVQKRGDMTSTAYRYGIDVHDLVPPPRMARLLTKKEIEKLQSLGAQQMDVEARNMLLGFG